MLQWPTATRFKRGGRWPNPGASNLFVATVLLALFAAPVMFNGAKTEVYMPSAANEVRIVNSGSTNTLGFTLTVAENAAAMLEQGNSREPKQLPIETVGRFFATLRAVGPLDALSASQCTKSASFGTTTKVFYAGKASPDISCPNPNPQVQELARDVMALVDATGAKVVPR